MRLWTLHPRYLDARGLVAVWREALLAQKVLQGRTKGYRHHPQLARFRVTGDPEAAVASYLAGVLDEATRRGYAFGASRISGRRFPGRIDATDGQLRYEWEHLRRKLERRDPRWLDRCGSLQLPEPHPVFRIVPGPVEGWERLPQGGATREPN